jgi:hypothetical protein
MGLLYSNSGKKAGNKEQRTPKAAAAGIPEQQQGSRDTRANRDTQWYYKTS